MSIATCGSCLSYCIAQILINLYLKEMENNKNDKNQDLKCKDNLINQLIKGTLMGEMDLLRIITSCTQWWKNLDTNEVSTMFCRNDLTTHWGLLELYWDNNCIIPIMLTSIRSHSCLSSHTMLSCGSSPCIKDLWITQGQLFNFCELL